MWWQEGEEGINRAGRLVRQRGLFLLLILHRKAVA